MVRSAKSIEKTREFKKILSKLKKDSEVVECIWKDENECEGKIITAHSIQNNRFLNKISENGDIYYFSPQITKDDELVSEFEKKGRKTFSTFRGFCQKHDKELFQAIEDHKYVGSDEQKFLFAFRAFAKEYHSKKQGIISYENLINMIINTSGEIESKNERLFLCYQMLEYEKITVDILKRELEFFKKEIKKKTFQGIYTKEIILSKEYPIVCNSLLLPYLNSEFEECFLEEETEKIQNGDLNPGIYLNIFPEDGKTYVLISCLEKYKELLKKFYSPLEKKENILNQISNIILMYAENTGFSPKYIKEFFVEQEIEKINEIFMENLRDPYFSLKKSINLFRE